MHNDIIVIHDYLVGDTAAVRDRPLELQDEDACYRLVHYMYVSSVGILCKHSCTFEVKYM